MADFKENVILGDQSIASLSTDFFFKVGLMHLIYDIILLHSKSQIQ